MQTRKHFLFTITCLILFIPTVRSQGNHVELLNLVAFKEDTSILVSWNTASEKNTLYFSVERSLNYYDYDSIGFVQAAGLSDSLISYLFRDNNPPLVECIYYRLKTRFNNFSSTTSYPCWACNFIYIQKTNVFYPQPVTDVSQLLLEGLDRTTPAHVLISDAAGKIFIDETIENTNHYTFLFYYCNRKDFPGKGIYYLRVLQNEKEIYQTEILVI